MKRFLVVALFLVYFIPVLLPAAPLPISDSLFDLDEKVIEKRYAESLSRGILSNDGVYYQRGGTLANAAVLGDLSKLRALYLNDVKVQSLSVSSDTLQRVKVDNSRVTEGLTVNIPGGQSLYLRDNNISGDVNFSGGSKANAMKVFVLRNKFKGNKQSGFISIEDIFSDEFSLLDNQFSKEVSLMDVVVKEEIWIQSNVFSDGVSLIVNDIEAKVIFHYNKVYGPAIFTKINFADEVSFNYSEFIGAADFSKSIFHKKPIFTRTRFSDVADFSGVRFETGTDLRLAKFSNKGIKLEAFQADMSIFYLDLDQIVTAGLLFLPPEQELQNPVKKKQEALGRLDHVYEAIIDQYQKRGLTSEADDLSLIYRREQNKIKQSLLDSLYDFFMGYGYETWRYIAFVVLPSIVAFALMYWAWFANEMSAIIRRKDQISTEELMPDKGVVQFARMAAMSSGILFAIRYKTMWIVNNDRFNHLVILNYLYGIGLYLAFSIGTRTSSFDVVKSMIGI